MTTTIIYAAVFLVEAIIIWFFLHNTFVCKRPKWLVPMIIFPTYILLFSLASFESIIINAVAFYLVNVFILCLLYQIKWYVSFFQIAVVTIIMMGTESLSLSLFPNYAYDFYDPAHYQRNLLILLFFGKSLYFLSLMVLSHLFRKKKDLDILGHKETLILCGIPTLSMFLFFTLTNISYQCNLSATLNTCVFACFFILLLINVLTFVIYQYLQNKHNAFTLLQLQYQKESTTNEYYRMLLQQEESKSILIHDIKKHLQTLYTFNDDGKQEQITNYIHQLLQSEELQSNARCCDLDILNIIIGKYKEQCRALQIDFQTDIRCNSIDFIEDSDITALFSNLLDNALEATKNSLPGFIELKISSKEDANCTIISVQNSCLSDPFENNPLLLSKKQGSYHGIGLKSIQRIVKKYNGNVTNYFDKGNMCFHSIIQLKKVITDTPSK